MKTNHRKWGNLFFFVVCVPQAFYFAGAITISYCVAFIVSVCVEYPTLQLEKLLFNRDHWAVGVTTRQKEESCTNHADKSHQFSHST